MHLDIALDQIDDAGSFAQGAPRCQRITTRVNLTAQFLGALARRRHAPFRPARECHPALAPGVTIVEREGSSASPIDAGSKAAHLGVENLVVPPHRGLGVSQNLLSQLLSVHHARTSLLDLS